SAQIRIASNRSPLSADTHQSVSPPNRCPFPLWTHTISPSPAPPVSHLPATLPSAMSPHPAGRSRIAGPAPATCTSFPDDLPDTSCPPDGVDMVRGAPDRFRTHQTPPAIPSAALQTRVFRSLQNISSPSSPRAAATHRNLSKCRSPFETATPPSLANSPCHATSTQTTALPPSAGNTLPCPTRTEFRPAHSPGLLTILRDSTAPPPSSSGVSRPSSPGSRTSSSARKNPPGPTSPPRSGWAPSLLSAPPRSRGSSRTRRTPDAPRSCS